MKFSAVIISMMIAMFSQLALAADVDPDETIKYRKSAMKAVGGHIGGLVAILKGKVPHKDALKVHADGFAASVDKAMMAIAFKQNTDGKGKEVTTSTALIWKDWGKFEDALVKLEAAAKDIQKAAAEGKLTSFDQLKPALSQCGYCHRKSGFRKKL